MTAIRVLLSKLRGLITGRKQDPELRQELDSHLAMLEEEYLRRGVAPEQARRQAHIQFGGVSQTEERYRVGRGILFLETLLQDIRYALRVLRRNPAFALVVILSLALGIGANTAIFSAINVVMLRMLPVGDPQRLVMLQWRSRDWPRELVKDLEGSSFKDERGQRSYSFDYQTYLRFRDQNHVFSSTIAFASNDDEVNVGVDGRAEAAVVQAVSGNYFEGVGVGAAMGRSLLPTDDQDGAVPTVVIGNEFWRRTMGASRDAVGKHVVINGVSFTVIGVMPAGFYGLDPKLSPDLYLPLTQYSLEQTRQGNQNGDLTVLKDTTMWWTGIAGRLRSGVTPAQAQAELSVLFDGRTRGDGALPGAATTPTLELVPLEHGLDGLRRKFSSSLMLLMGMVSIVLLVACGNVASLLLTRAAARQREIGVRLSLGAKRSRLVRQLLTESVMLAIIGGLLGLAVAKWAGSLLVGLLSSGRDPIYVDLTLDGRVLAFTFAVAIITGILFGLAPALRSTRNETVSSLKQVGVGLSRERSLTARVLVAGQVALCLLLVLGAGLLLTTLQKLKRVELGFDQNSLLLFSVRPGLNGYSGPQLQHYYEELQRRISAIPGVQSVGFSDRGPIGAGMSINTASIPGYNQGQSIDYYRHIVGPNYFEAIRLPIVLGRPIGPQDTASAPKVAVVNQKLANTYFHGDNPIGHQFIFGGGKLKVQAEIVGVVKDAKYAQIRKDVPPTGYLPYQQMPRIWNFMTFEVRSAGREPGQLSDAIRAEALAVDRDVPLVNIKTETEIIDQVLYLERAFAALSSSFALLALVLACVGLYGTMAYSVLRRTKEIGVRIALGAARGRILKMVLRETLIVAVGGLLVGVPAGLATTRVLKSQLYELSPHDPAIVVLAVVLLLGICLAAGYFPARKASRVDPMVALRYE